MTTSRRTFLAAAASLPIGLRTPVAPSAEAILVHEEFVHGDKAKVASMRDAVVHGNWRVVDPGLRAWYAEQIGEDPRSNAWRLWAERGEQRWLLDFHDSDEKYPGAEKEGFVRWLRKFSPRNCNDWLMVPTVYRRHVFDEDAIDWCSGPPFGADARIDEELATTRGLLLWRRQAEQFLASHGLSNCIALWSDFLLQDSVALDRFDRTFCGDRSLRQVLEERTLQRRYCSGLPRYHLAGFISGFPLAAAA